MSAEPRVTWITPTRVEIYLYVVDYLISTARVDGVQVDIVVAEKISSEILPPSQVAYADTKRAECDLSRRCGIALLFVGMR
ncbi:hypothetical protein EC912_103181 [Luteibacter rhizovicinus]|uniref:Uncharacterized protein n=2 Tax=Luteibacter rhizovicinus TaxID=242606 RepID=A0A4R3YQQ2_9GAMM|nr:hypothetical protein EC912_103181 [Luteibacter rhizovicinus]